VHTGCGDYTNECRRKDRERGNAPSIVNNLELELQILIGNFSIFKW
jgi:hypothetical protein